MGSGCLGTHLVNALIRLGAVVRAFGRTQTDPEELDERVHWSGGHFADPAAVAEAVRGQEIVFHLLSGAVPGRPGRTSVPALETNVLGTLRFLDICNTAAVRRIVFASSGGTVYGPASRCPIPEGAPTDPISAYGVRKLAIEKYLALYQHLSGLEYLSLRIDDLVSAFLLATTYDGPHRVVNVESETGLSINQAASGLETVAGTAKPSRIYRAGRTADVSVNILDISLITRDTTWRPRRPWPACAAPHAGWRPSGRRGSFDAMQNLKVAGSKPWTA